ncbi:MAG: hypothetical protein HYZ16_01675 [Bacteroidetes bacterium]|jgi:hypothetical protein|nr:hypothetical protein [Bacteroidota bacterium]
MNRLILTAAIGSMWLVSCTSQPKEQTHEGHDHEGHDHGTVVETAAGTSGINLVNGAKWKVDSEMLPHLDSMEQEIQSFSGSGLEDYHALAAGLKGHLNHFVSACTMKGQGHEELHKWLEPFMGKVDELAKAANADQAATQLQGIKDTAVEFHDYFE